MRFDGKVALVTGGGSGIGEAVSRALDREGASVAVLDVNADAAKLSAGLLERGLAVTADVTDSAAVDAAVDQVVAELGRLDVLVNNAGIADGPEFQHNVERATAQIREAATTGTISTPLEVTVSLTDEQWRRMLATHLDGTFYCTRAALRHMAGQGRGAIVNIASICGMEGCAGVPHYSAAKAGIQGFTRAVAKEVVIQGVRVNAVAPGFVDTPMLGIMSPEQKAGTVLRTPMARLGRPEEIAAAVVFLASDDASFVTGQTLSPNGGWLTA